MKRKVKKYAGGTLVDSSGNPVRSSSGEPVRTRYGKDDDEPMDEPMSEGPSVDAGMAKIEKEKSEIRSKLADKDLSDKEKDKLRAKLKRLTGYMN